MKKKILVLAVLSMFTSVIASGTLAYYTAEERVHNVITSGGVGIEIVEKTKEGSGVEVDFPKNGISGILPGTSVSKIVKVKNTGSDKAWIRVQIESSIRDEKGNEMPPVLGEDKIPVMEYEILSGWIDGGDGYYYYEAKVDSEEYTEILINEVTFNPAMGNEYQNCIANIVINAQAVQVANNGDTVMDAKGWPAADDEEGGES